MAGLYPPGDSSIKVEQIFDPSLPEVVGDAAALERVFLNLFRNAIEAIDGPGMIRLRTRIESKFRLRLGREHRRYLRVEVSDSGKGMTVAEQAQLFTPFFTTKPGGNGLGLVLSQRIIALHEGKLWAEPCEETLTGMTFKATLPLAVDVQAKYGESGIA
jgi:two-component system, NtrC family, nitrogen regulation sensor histidine kinase GlnL